MCVCVRVHVCIVRKKGMRNPSSYAVGYTYIYKYVYIYIYIYVYIYIYIYIFHTYMCVCVREKDRFSACTKLKKCACMDMGRCINMCIYVHE